MMEIVVKVRGMKCRSCEERVEKAVKEIYGVEDARADHNHNIVTLELRRDIDLEELKRKIDDLGYEVMD